MFLIKKKIKIEEILRIVNFKYTYLTNKISTEWES